MYKVKYGLVGALIGVIFGGVVYCGQELWAYISCNEVNTETTLKVFGIGVTIGLIIGIIVGAFADKEAKRAAIEAKRQAEEDARIAMQEERERQRQAAIQAEEYILKKWSEARLLPVLKAFDTIESIIDVDDNGNIIYAQPFYDQHNANNCRRKLDEIKDEAFYECTVCASNVPGGTFDLILPAYWDTILKEKNLSRACAEPAPPGNLRKRGRA